MALSIILYTTNIVNAFWIWDDIGWLMVFFLIARSNGSSWRLELEFFYYHFFDLLFLFIFLFIFCNSLCTYLVSHILLHIVINSVHFWVISNCGWITFSIFYFVFYFISNKLYRHGLCHKLELYISNSNRKFSNIEIFYTCF